MGHGDPDLFPKQFLEPGGAPVDGLRAVVEVVDLASPVQLPADGVGQEGPVVLGDVGLHRLAVGGGLLQGGHIPQPRQGHVQGPGNGGGGEGEHVHLVGQLFQLLLVGHPEALLLVHHQQAQVLELDALPQELVGADEEVHLPGGGAPEDVPGLLGGAEPGDHLHSDGEVGKPLDGGEVMLPGQHRGGHQHGGLLAVQYALHDGPEGHLGLAVAHVPAEETVHGHGLFHVGLDLPDAAELVLGLGIGKEGLKVLLPGGIRGEGVARQPLPLGVELDEALGQVLGGGLGPGLGLFPPAGAQLGEPVHRGVLPAADVFAHQVQLKGGDVEGVRPGELELDVVLFHPVHGHLHHAGEPADAVVLVDHQVPGGQVGEGFQLLPVGPLGLGGPALPGGGRSAPLRQDGELPVGEVEAPGEPAHRQEDAAGLGQGVEGLVHGGVELFLPEHGLEGVGLPPAPRQDHHGVVLPKVLPQVLGHRLEADPVAGELPGGEGQHGFGGRREGSGEEGVQVQEGPVLCPGAEVLQAPGKDPGLAAGEVPRLLEGQQVLAELPQPALGPLLEPGQVAQTHQGVLWQIVRGGDRFPAVDRAQEPVPGLVHGLSVGGEDLPGGEKGDGLPLGGPPLGHRVEEAHGVDLVPPEFQPDGEVQAGGEHVQDAPPQGELPRPLHLVAPAVAGGGEGVGEGGQVQGLAHG